MTGFRFEVPADAPEEDFCSVCDEYLPYAGSHYHCGNCDGVTGMMGHYIGGFFCDGKFIPAKRPDGSSWFTCDPDYEEAKRNACAR